MSENKVPIDEPINVSVSYKSFKDGKTFGVKSLVGPRKMIPISFRRKNGDEHTVSQLRTTRPFRKGKGEQATTQIHYIVRTTDDRYFDLMYDIKKVEWRVLYELDDQMMIEAPG
jgi:CxxC motif-containing protein